MRETRPTPWIGATAIVLLIAGLALASRQWRPGRWRLPPAPPATDSSAADSGEDVIHRALAQIPVDSTALKSRWTDDLKGVDLAGLSPVEKELILRHANAERCTCGCGF